ncbi:hypothetical protein H4582DRAFT_1128922 [Lactarius indigo]|nr:hypothetical protein H4582DRAFT_1128922 [Lactarius indigo]
MTRATARENSENEMWSGYMEEADKYDTLATDLWKYNADGVLVFAGLLSATVAAFIIESYKKLSPDSGNQTVYLLGQISQQLAAFPPNGTSFPPTPYPEYYPSLSIILVNSLWLLSLVSSIASAVVAALIQSWTRRYTLLPQIPSVPRDRARVRYYSFLGVSAYHMSRATEAGAMLLHLSVFLFFAGLVIFFFTIFKPVAVVVSTCVGFFGFVYLVLTILPLFDHRCPYHTPMTNICWYYWHTSLVFFGLCTRRLLRWLHGILVPSNLGEVTSSLQRIPATWCKTWWQFFDDIVKKHGRRLKDGSLGTVVQRAIESDDVDPKALTWLLNQPAFAGMSKIQEYSPNTSRLSCEVALQARLGSTRIRAGAVSSYV